MKFKKYIGWSFGLMALLSSCADNDIDNPYRPWDGKVSDELTLNLNVADPELVRLGQTRGEDGPLTSVTVMQYKGNTYLDKIDNVSVTDGKITVRLNKETTDIQLVANYSVPASCQNLAGESVNDALPKNADDVAAWSPILWGKASLSDIRSGKNNPDVLMIRHTAKVSIASKPDDFTITGFNLYNVAESGAVAPSLNNFKDGKATEPNGVSYSDDEEIYTGTAYIYETSKKSDTHHPKIILEAEYNGVKGYYVAGFRKRSANSPVPNGVDNYPEQYKYEDLEILRNHHYSLTIESVRAEGWQSLAAAKAAEPDNRATIWVSDETEYITDMIASRDYMLGVSADVTAEWNENAVVYVTTSYPKTDGNPVSVVCLDPTATEWIHTNGMEKVEETLRDTSERGKAKTVKKITYTLKLDQNSNQTAERVGYIEVRVGDLSRKVKITQKGNDLRRARTALIYGLTGVKDGTNYYDWVASCLGVNPKENRGLERNNALIFAAVPAYDIYYNIPMKTTGQTKNDTRYELDNTTDFEVTNDGTYWTVKAKGDGPKLASAKLTLIGGEDGKMRIDYELLRVGFFHKLETKPVDGKSFSQTQLAKGNLNWDEWHYYEVVKNGDYYFLDRNLGATSNNSYDPSNTNYTEEDENAIGGYFVVNPEKAKYNTTTNTKRWMDLRTVTEYVGLVYDTGKFHIPSEDEFKKMGVTDGNHGSGALCIDVEAGSKVANSIIYIPAAGYYFGNTAKNAVHVDLWTRSLLGGSQGLVEGDDEYGTQYRYLDAFGGVVNFGNLRTSAGAGGVINSNLRNYVPIRLVWRSTSDPLSDDVEIGDSSEYTFCIHGELEDGSWKDIQFSSVENGKYIYVNANMEAGYFGIKMIKDGKQVNWISADGNSDIPSNGATLNCKYSGNDFHLQSNGNYKLTFDPLAMTLKVEGNGTTPSISYEIHGSILSSDNSWSTESMELDSFEPNVWVMKNVSISKGKFLIKEKGKEVYYGASNGQQVIKAGTEITLQTGDRKDMEIEAGIYTITFNSATKVMTVAKVLLTPGTDNGWDSGKSMALTSMDDGKTFYGVAHIKDDFKFYDGSNWYGKTSEENKIMIGGQDNNLNANEDYYWVKVEIDKLSYSIVKLEKVSVSGVFNSWGDALLNHNSDHTVWSGNIDFSSSNDKWKLRANGGWGLSWGGKQDNVSVNKVANVALGGKDLNSIGNGKHNIRLDLSRQPFRVFVDY